MVKSSSYYDTYHMYFKFLAEMALVNTYTHAHRFSYHGIQIVQSLATLYSSNEVGLIVVNDSELIKFER